MSRKSLSLFLLILSGLVLIGCNRGCTTSRTIASESTTISTNGGSVEIVGRVIDYRHSKRRGDDVLDRKVSHSYGLSFDLKYGTFEQKEFFHQGVEDPKAVNLGKELKRVKVEISKDQNHIGLGVDGKIVDVIHLYKSNRISTSRVELLEDGTDDWLKLDIDSYPSPESILTESLLNSCDVVNNGSDAIYEFCNSSKPSAKIHKIMLNKWPSCRTAQNYLTEKKVQELSKSENWKKSAEKRGKAVLKNIEKYSFEFDEVMIFMNALDSRMLDNLLDEVLMEKWGRKGMMDYTRILVNRINQNNNPLKNSTRQALYEEAKEEFCKFENSGKSNYQREAAMCLQVLSALDDTTTSFEFIQNSFGNNASRFDNHDFLEVAYDDFSVYTDYQQQLIIQKTEATFESFKGYSRSSYFSAINGLVDCAMLNRLKNRYPEDLKTRTIPHRCR